MTTTHTTTTSIHSGSHAMGGSTMPGMTPLTAGADGTSATAGGLTLKADTTAVSAGKNATLGLTVTDAQGMPVTQFERDQTKLMHLIVAREDFTGYQHLHPTLGADGHFTVPLTLAKPGKYHAIADFTTGGKRYALAVVLTAPGTATAATLPAPATMAMTDGFQVELKHGAITARQDAEMTFTVNEGGKPVTALQPYLGAYGHLVALHKPDLAYSHVHPTADDLKTGTIRFSADFPTAGDYRLYLQFRTGGRVHTAEFTVTVAQ